VECLHYKGFFGCHLVSFAVRQHGMTTLKRKNENLIGGAPQSR
jgi:hypothetical protein